MLVGFGGVRVDQYLKQGHNHYNQWSLNCYGNNLEKFNPCTNLKCMFGSQIIGKFWAQILKRREKIIFGSLRFVDFGPKSSL